MITFKIHLATQLSLSALCSIIEEQIQIWILLYILFTNHFTLSFSLPPFHYSNMFEIIEPKLTELSNDKQYQWTKFKFKSNSNNGNDKANFLLTFNAERKPYYALLKRAKYSSINSVNILDDIGCNFYYGHLISPNPGQIVATICQNGNFSNDSILYSTILSNDGVFMIRAIQNANIAKNSSIKQYRPKLHRINENKLMNVRENEFDLFHNRSMVNLNSHYLLRFSANESKETIINGHGGNAINIPAMVMLEKHRKRRQTNMGNNLNGKVYSIETIIFVDKTLIRRFNGARPELQKLILAIMNEVQLIYNFDSLKTRIRIVIKKIVYLDDNHDSPNTANGDIDLYLDNFCAWQKRLWKRTEKAARWDHALLMTGLDLYKQIGNEKNNKVLGLAWVNGMCRPSYSCTINEAKNFESAFVIAHELAHSLGILHDGFDNNCDSDKFIMSDKTGPGKIHWSSCSNLYLDNFLKKTNLKCLERTSEETSPFFYLNPSDGGLDTRLPGQQYTLNQQCQLALGNNYRAYIMKRSPFNDICKELWCSYDNWASPAHPALEGSVCDRDKACSQGQCIEQAELSQNSYLNRHQLNSHENYILDNTNSMDSGGNSNKRNGSTVQTGSSFMKKVQRFLRKIVRFFFR